MSATLFRELAGLPAVSGFGDASAGLPVTDFATDVDALERLTRDVDSPSFLERLRAFWTPEVIGAGVKNATQLVLDKIRGQTVAEGAIEAGGEQPGFEDLLNLVAERYQDESISFADVSSHVFEDFTARGLATWVFGNAPFLKANLRKRSGLPFRRHSTAADYVYPLRETDGIATMAFLADFGTGYSHARYIGHQLRVDQTPNVFALGDVYYTGTPRQYDLYVTEPLHGAIKSGNSQFFFLADNHDQYSGYAGFWEYLDAARIRYPGTHPQQGSYWCVRGKGLQVLGIDTVYLYDPKLRGHQGRYEDQLLVEWLELQLRQARKDNLLTILCTSTAPYTGKQTHPILDDLTKYLGDIALWFWGDEHYGALFADRGFPFFGSCVGHSGFPFQRRQENTEGPPALFFETGSRYYPLEYRPEVGRNGFCNAQWKSQRGSLSLRYVDWAGRLRHEVEFSVSNRRLAVR